MIETQLSNWVGSVIQITVEFIFNMRGGLTVLFFVLGFASLVGYIMYLMRKEILELRSIR